MGLLGCLEVLCCAAWGVLGTPQQAIIPLLLLLLLFLLLILLLFLLLLITILPTPSSIHPSS